MCVSTDPKAESGRRVGSRSRPADVRPVHPGSAPPTPTLTETAARSEQTGDATNESSVDSTATRAPARGGATETAEPREDPAAEAGTATAGSAAESTRTASDDDRPATATRPSASPGGDRVVAPTVAEGPGLGAVSTLVALAVLALLARRR